MFFGAPGDSESRGRDALGVVSGEGRRGEGERGKRDREVKEER